jgi:hypothetical protein
MEPRSAEYFSAQVLQKDVGSRLQAGQELLLYLGAPGAIPDLEEDPGRLDKTVDALIGWVGSSNYRVSGAAGRGGTAVLLLLLGRRPFKPGRTASGVPGAAPPSQAGARGPTARPLRAGVFARASTHLPPPLSFPTCETVTRSDSATCCGDTSP